MKLKELIRDITVRHVLGVLMAHIYAIEFQKRSLPHCNMLMLLISLNLNGQQVLPHCEPITTVD